MDPGIPETVKATQSIEGYQSRITRAIERAKRPVDWVWICLGLGVFAVAGLLASGGYWYDLAAYYSMRGWEETTARIVRSDWLRRDAGPNMAVFGISVDYEYKFRGVVHRGSRVSLYTADNFGTFQRDVFAKIKQHHTANVPIACYVNPTDPSQSILFRDLRPQMQVVGAVISLPFVLIGWVVLPFNAAFDFVRVRRERRFRREQESAHPAEPWLWKEPWAKAEMVEPSGRKGVIFVLVALAWNIDTIPLWFSLPTAAQGDVWSLAAAALIAIGWLIALRAIIVWRRHRRSIFRMSEIPAITGGQLTGEIETTANPDAAGGFFLTLRCIQNAGDANGSTATNSEEILWEETQAISNISPARGFGSVAMPVRFSTPSDSPSTSEGSGDEKDRVMWQLVLATNPPIDGKTTTHAGVQVTTANQSPKPPLAVFEVPVFAPVKDSPTAE
jgi:Protein of unknown function (DUF3592)